MPNTLSDFRNATIPSQDAPCLINREDYSFAAYLANDLGEIFPLSYERIKSCVIQDNIFHFGLKGTLVFENEGYALEKQTASKNSGESAYRFQNNGRDFLILRIRPTITKGDTKISNDFIRFITIEERFVIHGIRDVNADKKYLQLDFHTLDEQMMLEQESFFSTAAGVKYDVKDEARKMYTGTALKTVLGTLFPTDAFASTWDEGMSKVFYTAIHNESVLMTVGALLKMHATKGGAPGLLRKDSATGKISLIALDTLFKSALGLDGGAGTNFLDAYRISLTDSMVDSAASLVDASRPNGSLFIPDNNIISYNIENKDYSSSFQFFQTKIVNSYDTKKGAFTTNVFSVEKMVERYRDMFVAPFSSLGSVKPNIIIPNEMLKQKQFTSSDNPYLDSVKSTSMSEIMFNQIFLNTVLNFSIKGGTYRKPGYFIHVEPATPAEKNTLSKSIFGHYLICGVEHRFEGTAYTTSVSAVKTYTGA